MPRRVNRSVPLPDLEEEEGTPQKGSSAKERLPTENEVWYLIHTYFERYGFVRHQVESFNHFISSLLPHIVQESSEVRVRQGTNEEHVVSLCNLSVLRPTSTDADGVERDILPHLARMRGMTYASAVLVDVVHDIYVDEKHTERRIFRETCLCRLPVMLGSQCCHTQHREDTHECRLDPGGYFLVSGIEKVIVAQEKLHHNTPYVFLLKQPSRYAMQCEIRSVHERKLRSTSSLYLHVTNTKRGAVPDMVATLPFLTSTISVMALFRLLGVAGRSEALDLTLGEVDPSTEEQRRMLSAILDTDYATVDMTREEVFEHVGKECTREHNRDRRLRYMEHIVNCEVLPHQGLTGSEEVLRSKALYLGLMVRKLLRVYRGELPCDDRDHFAAKRIDCSGTQFALLFRQVFRNVLRSLTLQLQRAADAKKLGTTNVGNLVSGKKLTQAFRYALATGNWGIKSAGGLTAQNSVAQQLTRMTVPATISLLRKVSTPVARETKNPKPRQLHPTSWGLLCPMDTPEGSACGLTKALSMLAHVRIGTFSTSALEQLRCIGMQGVHAALEADGKARREGIPVLLNGVLHFYAETQSVALELLAELRRRRCAQLIPFDTTLVLAKGLLHIDTDTGCLLRPLLRVDKLHALPGLLRAAASHEMLIDHLLREGALEYVDKQEEEHLRVAVSPYAVPEDGWAAYTHCEIDPSMIVGVCGSVIPFADYNQSPRNTYQSAMMKQALGVYTINHKMRMDTIAHTMVSPQRPLVTTRMDSVLGVSDAPAGVNCIIAILCYTGQNQEDSIIINQASLERGMFRSVKLQTYREEEQQHGGSDAERIEKVSPGDPVQGMRHANYDNVDETGVVKVGTHVREGDVLISKTVTTTDLGEGARKPIKRDKSTVMRHEGGVVDAVLRAKNTDGTRMVRVRVRKTRTPIVGDKFSSRMGQKGVIGITLPQEDMPYTADGMVPDIIVNPHAIPSRMTIGQLAEQLLAILCTLRGERGDGTMFRGGSLEQLSEELQKLGYDRYGRVELHNGFTGEAFPAKVFMGPTFYQRLRHMAADKDHARARGPIHMLSRQPTEGRARDGGLRFGEMERDTIIAHGAAEFLRDRLLDNSDPSELTLCGTCGLLAQPQAAGTHVRHKKPSCRNCGNEAKVFQMGAPFAFRLLMQELQAMSIAVRFEF